MATRVKNDKGFLVIKCSVFDLMETEPASMGICDKCGNHDLSGYIICALGHRWYCNECYHKWEKQAVYYPEDQDFETKIFNEYRKNFILAKRWEKNDEKK